MRAVVACALFLASCASPDAHGYECHEGDAAQLKGGDGECPTAAAMPKADDGERPTADQVIFETVEGLVWTITGAGANERNYGGPNARKTALGMNAVADKILSERHWLAAGLPCVDSGFQDFRFPDDSTSLEARQWFNDKAAANWQDTLYGRMRLKVDGGDNTGPSRQKFLDRNHADRLELAQGFEPESHDLARSWHVLSWGYYANRQRYRHLIGFCFHDDANLEVELDGWVTAEQATRFQKLIEESSVRLAAVCEGDLKPYIERVKAASTRPVR